MEQCSFTNMDKKYDGISLSIKETKADEQSCKISPYDEMIMRYKREPRFLEHIREWEKYIGFVTPLRWTNIIIITSFQILFLVFPIYYFSTNGAKWQTIAFTLFMGHVAGFGVTGGVHRYWTHRSYKAKWPLQVILLLCYSVAGQNTVPEWVRDHRVHHKHSETSADPHDARRGFFYSHMGWFMMKKHPDVLRAGAKIDISDITNDPLVQFHTKYFTLFKLTFCFVLPPLVPIVAWGDTLIASATCVIMIRYTLSLHATWAVNSFAHLWGNKPYNRHIMPSENWMVAFWSLGEGWHNFHHTFPWDYRTAELGMSALNHTAYLLNFFSLIGWAYDLKTASPALIEATVKKSGAAPQA